MRTRTAGVTPARSPTRRALRPGRIRAAVVALAMGLVLGGCGADAEDARRRAERVLEQGGEVIQGELESALAACSRALAELEGALGAAGDDRSARLDAVEALRARNGLSGLDWSGPGAERVWAGRPLAPRALPAPSPWDGSFRDGRLTYHAGPFLRALVVGPTEALGGHGVATWILEERAPDDPAALPFAGRWLTPLDLWEVRLEPPGAPGRHDADEACCREVAVRGPAGTGGLQVHLRVHDLEALGERIKAEQERLGGVLLLLLLAAAVVLAVRFGRHLLRPGGARWLAGALLVLLVRGALRLLDLPGRFPLLMEAFSPSEFALDTPLGWLGSPGDFALSAVAYLLVTLCVTYGLRDLPNPRRLPGCLATVAAALLTSGLAAGLWLLTVEVAVSGGQTPFFQAHTFVPGAPVALMLTGLVAVTATTYLIAHLVLRRAWRAFPHPQPTVRRLALALLACGATAICAGLLAEINVVVFAIPVLACLVVGRAEGRLGLALPSRVLVLSVMATALAYPVLWARVGERENEALAEILEDVLGSEDIALAGVAAALDEARGDPHLRAGLREAAAGGRPEALALHLWLRSAPRWQRYPAVVSVLDPEGRQLDRFALETLARHMLPAAQKPTRDDLGGEIFVSRGGPRRLRSVVGRVGIEDDDGTRLGHVVLTVPDRMDLHLKGLAGLAASAPRGSLERLVGGQPLQFVRLEGGALVASSDPSLSRARGRFGPPALAGLHGERSALGWTTARHQGYARWDPERGAVFGVRQAKPSAGYALLALARLVVVGVGLGLLAAVACLLAGLGSLRLQLHHKILLSYFFISVIPLVLLGVASAREAQERHDARMTERLETDVARARGELELMGPYVFDTADSTKLEQWAPERRHDVLLYQDGDLQAASRTGLVACELLARRLPADAYRATVLERRQIIRKEAVYAGRRVWLGYAPVLDGEGLTRATVGVPLLYEADRVEEQLTVTGSVLLAAYMLTLVLVLVGGIYAARRLTRPLGVLADGTKQVAAGHLDVRLEGAGTDEFGQLVAAFNRMTAELREATDRAVRAERESAWRRMASQVAHEIKNPLTPMRLMAQQMLAALQRDPATADETIQRTAPLMLRQIEALDRIARDFANFARLPKRRKTQVDVAQLIREVTALHSGAAAEGIRVHCELAPDLPPVFWDEEELRRVLLNMVLNALESIEGSGEVLLRAEPAVRDGERGVRVEVRDDGVGIAPEHVDRLFEPQFSTKTSGTGLGLAIVSRILEDMGGAIEVHSEPGAGTAFELWWPTGGP